MSYLVALFLSLFGAPVEDPATNPPADTVQVQNLQPVAPSQNRRSQQLGISNGF